MGTNKRLRTIKTVNWQDMRALSAHNLNRCFSVMWCKDDHKLFKPLLAYTWISLDVMHLSIDCIHSCPVIWCAALLYLLLYNYFIHDLTNISNTQLECNRCGPQTQTQNNRQGDESKTGKNHTMENRKKTGFKQAEKTGTNNPAHRENPHKAALCWLALTSRPGADLMT